RRCGGEKYNAARADFEQRMLDSAVRFQEVEEAHLRYMKGLIGSYSHSVEDTHVQIGQVHEEFKQNVENIGTETLLRRFAESKGTGRERPGALDFDEYRLAPAQEGPKRSRSKAFRIPGLSRKERDPSASPSISPQGCPEVDEDGFTVRPDVAHSILAENHVCSSSDSDYDEDEPRKFYVHIKPVQPREAASSAEATMEQLKATVGNLILPPSIGGTVKRQSSRHVASLTPARSDADPEGTLAAGDGAGRGRPAAQVNSCLVKVTGELTMSFPAGIVRVFSGSMAPPVLSFRLLNAGAIEQFLPNAELLYSDPSQSDPSTKDFWLNMAALTGHLQKQAEQSPAASYYNVALLKYQFSRLGPGSAPLRRLSASWEPLCGPSKPSPVAAQFSSEGSTLSGVEVELASAGYRMSLVKKRFATAFPPQGSTWQGPEPPPTGPSEPLGLPPWLCELETLDGGQPRRGCCRCGGV
ncbi:PREDICTED: F-BAR domain only protein 1, partial [Aptenodytes forsteri]|uniref:F-BAR domain only protein 1 n=1 Tax=Aptenodytes forsteri TaxID=9233 RepID=UPI0004F43FCD